MGYLRRIATAWISGAASIFFTALVAVAEPPSEIARAKEQLESGNESVVLEALKRIASQKDPRFSPLVANLLSRGSTPKVIVVALDTAGQLKDPTLSEPAAPYISHRVSEVRRGAVRALLRTQGAAAVTALRKGLRSQDAVVRGIAASGLGSLGAKEALPDLILALDHQVGEAAASIGQLCDPETCENLLERLGKAPFEVVTGGLDQILFRPAKEVPDQTKIKIVVRLGEVGTREALRYLGDVLSRWPKDGSTSVKQALEQTQNRRSGGGR